MTWITAASFTVVLMVVCSAVAEKYVTIIRSSSAPEHFIYPRSNELPSSCTSFNGSLSSSSGSRQDCTCKNTKETFAYSENKWSCVGPDLYVAQNISGSASCRLRYKNREWISTFKKNVAWIKIDNLSKDDGKCNIDWSASSALRCGNIMEPISTKSSHPLYSNNGQYGLSVTGFPKEIEGRIIKIVIRCKKHNLPETDHCLMLKLEGQIKCPFIHHIKSTTTPNIVTSSVLSSTAKVHTETKVTVHPTTKVEAKNKKREQGSSSRVPVPAIAGGIAAVLISVIVIIVLLVCRRKCMRKNDESDNQDLSEQLHQDKKEPRENELCSPNNMQPSCVVQTEDATPVYEKIPSQKNNSVMSSKENLAAVGTPNPSSPYPDYDSVWDCVKVEGSYQNIHNKPWNSVNSDYAVPEGSLDETLSQSVWYDVPEREVGTLKHLSGSNHYDKAGEIISDEKPTFESHVGQQDDEERITANPLYGVV